MALGRISFSHPSSIVMGFGGGALAMTEDGTGIKVPERIERKEEGRLGDMKGSREGAGCSM
jgi:hypothetical protein